ncbi:hypothetical protein ACEPAG_5056 [Sanghuangporus baumii]
MQQELRLDINPEVVGLLQNVISRLNVANTPEGVFFNAGEIDSWKPNGTEHPAANLARIRDGLQELQKIMEASALLAAAAEAFIPTMKAKLVHFGLFSLPMETVQDILYRSMLDGQTYKFDLKRALALQSVSRYFRDVVRSTPEFWTSASSKNIPLLKLQLERSKDKELHLDIFERSILLTDVYELIIPHSTRLRTMAVHLEDYLPDPNVERSILKGVYSLNMVNLRSLEIHSNFVTGERLSIARIQAPKLRRLLLSNIYQIHGIGASLTELNLTLGYFARWSARHLVTFVVHQQSLKKLVLCIRSKPEESGAELDELLVYRLLVHDREMFAILKLDSWASATALDPVWPTLCGIHRGLKALKLDLSGLAASLQLQVLANAIHYASCSIETLSVSLSADAPASNGHVEYPSGEKHDLPITLRTMIFHNCPREPLMWLLGKLLKLRAMQEAYGIGLFDYIMFVGNHPSQADLDSISNTLLSGTSITLA